MSGYYPHAFAWTDEAVALTKKLAADGYSASQIALQVGTQFGAKLSRNAVIGKLYRMGTSLKQRRPQSSAGTVRRRGRPITVAAKSERAIRDFAEQDVPRRQIARLAGVAYEAVRAVLGDMSDDEVTARRARPSVAEANKARSLWFDPTEPREIKTGAVEASQPVSLFECKPIHCRWPLPGDEFRFCGAIKVEGHSYCKAHCRAAYQPPPKRTANAPVRPAYSPEKAFRRFA